MNGITRQALGRAFATIAIAALLTACVDGTPVGPRSAARALDATADAGARDMDLGSCGNLAPRTPSKLAFLMYAEGVQVYRWNGTSWGFVAPVADLFADAARNGKVGTHYAGPKWETFGGSIVSGAVVDRCVADAGSIPWLLLAATPAADSGQFHKVNFIQRVNTVGGNAPSAPGTVVGEMSEVPYTALYRFFRAE